MHTNDTNKKHILFKELSYKIAGLCFKVHNELGRFCREKQKQLMKNSCHSHVDSHHSHRANSHRLSIIAAIGRNRELGKDNRLLWHIPQDLKHFKKLTANHTVIMGRKTFESIGRPLPKRNNIVITRNADFNPAGCIAAGSLEKALEKAKEVEKNGEIFIIGGASVYQQSMKIADRLYLTVIDQEFPTADAFFPDYSRFNKLIFEKHGQSGNLKFKFAVMES